MSSVDDESTNALEEECLFRPEAQPGKIHNGNAVEKGSFAGDSQAIVVHKSMKTVVFSNKLNFLIPFGPLAILVDKFTGHHVYCLWPSIWVIPRSSWPFMRELPLSSLGSILSNMLLVLGCAFFYGGIVHRRKEQTSSKRICARESQGLYFLKLPFSVVIGWMMGQPMDSSNFSRLAPLFVTVIVGAFFVQSQRAHAYSVLFDSCCARRPSSVFGRPAIV